MKQLAGDVFFSAEHAQAASRPLTHLCGVRAEKARRRRDDAAIYRREVERQVMAFDAPAPLAFVRRLAKERKVIKRRVAACGGCCIAGRGTFNLAQHQFDLHNRRGFVITALAERYLEKLLRQLALGFVEFFEGDST